MIWNEYFRRFLFDFGLSICNVTQEQFPKILPVDVVDRSQLNNGIRAYIGDQLLRSSSSSEGATSLGRELIYVISLLSSLRVVY